MRKLAQLLVIVLFTNALIACGTPASVPDINLLKPGDRVGEMVLTAREVENAESSIFSYCEPIIGESEPSPIIRECNVPRLPNLLIGYGEFAGTQDELDLIWQSKTWELYVDGQGVDLPAFGTFDLDWGTRFRVWKVMLENPTPGSHRLRYISRTINDAKEPLDVTWIIHVDEQSAFAIPSSAPDVITYPALSSTINTGQHPYSSEKANLNFLLYIPLDYGKDPQQEWPLILFLHGANLAGNDLNKLRQGELSGILGYAVDFPYIVVSPQLLGEGEQEVWWQDGVVDSLLTLLDEIQERYSVDPKRIYLTGSSLGGGATWTIGLRYPEKFAALIPVMGFYGFPFEVPADICKLKDVPIWAFHGTNDEFVPLDAEKGLVEALRACGGNVKFTVYEGAGHDIDIRAYLNPALYIWLSSQSLK